MQIKPITAPWGESYLFGTPLLLTTVIGVGAGFLVFGYDQGISNALTGNVEWNARFSSISTNTSALGAVLGTFVLGAMCGALLNFQVGNRVGRRTMLAIGTLGTIIFGALQAGSTDLAMFVATRFLNGAAVGLHTSTVATYIGELTKRESRGRITAFELGIGGTGLAISFWVTYGFRNDTSSFGWRMPLAIQPILSVVSLVFLLWSPESPRWYTEKGRKDEAVAVLTRLYGREYAVKEVQEIEEAIAIEREAASQYKGIAACFQNNSQCFRYRTMLGLGVNFFQQFTGVNMATYFAGPIMITGVGLGLDRGLLALGGAGIAASASVWIGCFLLVEPLGRVRTMMLGSFLCCIGQLLLAAGIANLTPGGPGSYVGAFGLYLFLCGFSACWLAPGWTYAAEISPLAIRSRVAGLGAAVQYLCNFAIVEITPVGTANIGYKFYVVFCILNAAMIPVLYLFFPEVARLSLEEVDELFVNGKVHVRRSPREAITHSQMDAHAYRAKHGEQQQHDSSDNIKMEVKGEHVESL